VTSGNRLKTEHLFRPQEPDEHDDDTNQFKNEKKVEIAGNTDMDTPALAKVLLEQSICLKQLCEVNVLRQKMKAL